MTKLIGTGGRRQARASAIAALAVLGSLAGSTAALAQEARPAADKTGTKWVVRCSNVADPAKLACRVTHALVDGRSRARVLSVNIVPGGQFGRMRLGLPHGSALQNGVDVSIDGGVARKVPIVTADANGAYADLDIDADTMASLRAGRTMKVAFASSAGRPIALDIDLAGFSVAYELFKR